MTTFTPTGLGNSILDHGKDGWFVSYNPDPALGRGPETALVTPDPKSPFGRHFRILDGDFRKEYEAAGPDLDACIKVYETNRAAHRSMWDEGD